MKIVWFDLDDVWRDAEHKGCRGRLDPWRIIVNTRRQPALRFVPLAVCDRCGVTVVMDVHAGLSVEDTDARLPL